MDTELRHYFDSYTEDLMRSGLPREEAQRQVRLQLGALESLKEECRDARGPRILEGLMQDLRYALRALRKNPGFAAVAILTLALGIGANTAVFSVVNAVLLRPLPYKDANRLVWITYSERNSTWHNFLTDVDYVTWRDKSQLFEDMAAFGFGEPQTLATADGSERIYTTKASANFFQLLGVQPRLGRGFLSEEGRVGSGAAPVVIITDSLWRKDFSANPSIIGREIALNNKPYTVVGVLPPVFEFPDTKQPDLIFPLPIPDRPNARDPHIVSTALARLRPGISSPHLADDLDAIRNGSQADYLPGFAKMLAAGHAVAIPLHQYLVGDHRLTLLILLGAVGFVLLIACANVANLQLARAISREREIAVRSALGARPWRLARQLLTESSVLSLASGAFGLFLAAWLVALARSFGPSDIPHLADARLDLHVLSFALCLSLLAGFLFGLAPALTLKTVRLAEPLKEGGGRSGSGSRTRRLQSVMTVAEVALALALLVGAGLLARTLQNLLSIPPGFDPHHVLTARVALPDTYKTIRQDDEFYLELLDRLRALPGVISVGATDTLPYTQAGRGSVIVEGRTPPPQSQASMEWTLINVAMPGYFATLRTPLLAGRYLDAGDLADFLRSLKESEEPLFVSSNIVINQAFARRYFPNSDPLQKKIKIGLLATNAAPWQTIVGVVGDYQQHLAAEPQPECFLPWSESITTFVIRSDGDPTGLLPAIREQVATLDKNVPVEAVETMDHVYDTEMATRRFSAWILSAFAVLAILLAGVGIYGIMAYAVSQRTREIGVRVALGADSVSVLRMVLVQGLKLALVGVGIGLATSLALTRIMKTMLYGVTPTDPITFAAVTTILIVVALAACYIPARRAMRLDPLAALRRE